MKELDEVVDKLYKNWANPNKKDEKVEIKSEMGNPKKTEIAKTKKLSPLKQTRNKPLRHSSSGTGAVQ